MSSYGGGGKELGVRAKGFSCRVVVNTLSQAQILCKCRDCTLVLRGVGVQYETGVSHISIRDYTLLLL